MYAWNNSDTIAVEAVLRERHGVGGIVSSSTRAPWGQEALDVIRKHFYEGARGIGSSSTRGQRSTIPEILHSGLLVGKHPTSITGIKIPLPIGTGWGRYLPAILNSGFQDGAEALLRERQRGRRHIGGEKQF